MKDQTCAVVCSAPMHFPWGYNEDDEGCRMIKFMIRQEIFAFYAKGVCHFSVAIDSGYGLYAAEIINDLRKEYLEMELVCYIPYEEQATKWSLELRSRYFDALAECSDVVYIGHHYSSGCRYKAKLAAIASAAHAITVRSSKANDAYMELLLHYMDMQNMNAVHIQPKKLNSAL